MRLKGYRYIFSTEISNFIDKAKATEDLVMSFLAYLSSDVLDSEQDGEEIDEKILTGQYRLFQYASFYWPALLPPIESSGASRELEKLLDRAVENGRNYDFESDTGNSESLYKNEYLQRKLPQVYDMLCATFRFHLDDKRWEWNWGNSRRFRSKYSWSGPKITANVSFQISIGPTLTL